MIAPTAEPAADAWSPATAVRPDALPPWERIYPLGWDSRSSPRHPRFLVAIDHGEDADAIARPGKVRIAIGDVVCDAMVHGVAYPRDPRDAGIPGAEIPCLKRVLALDVPHEVGRGRMVTRLTWIEPEPPAVALARQVLGDTMPPPPTSEQLTEYDATVMWDPRPLEWGAAVKVYGPRPPRGVRTLLINGIESVGGGDSRPPDENDPPAPQWWPVSVGASEVFNTCCWARPWRPDDDEPPPSTSTPATTDAHGFPLYGF